MELNKLAAARRESMQKLVESIPGYDVEAKTHNAVAAAVLTGKADVGLGIRTVADQNGLGFIPLRDEEYDFVLQKNSMDKPAVKAFLEIIDSADFKQDIGRLGYRRPWQRH